MSDITVAWRYIAMKMELLNLSPTEQRILLLFESANISSRDEQVDEYLHAHELEPKRQYSETREGTDYLIYYFGGCYLEGHIDHLASMATEANLEGLIHDTESA